MKYTPFQLKSEYRPTGDQPEAIDRLTEGLLAGERMQTLLGVTGSGKTFTMANVIARMNRPTLILEPNKTLAAQVCTEMREFFPDAAVEFFVSYYDYYQPEAYIPGKDMYIEKDALVNDEIDRLRHSATSALFERRDVIIVASVSCIYSLGDPGEYQGLVLAIRPGSQMSRDIFIRKLVANSYNRNDLVLERDSFRVNGDTVEIIPANMNDSALRVEFFGDEIDRISEINIVTGELKRRLTYAAIYPATHYAVSDEKREAALLQIEREMVERVAEFEAENKLIEAQRIRERVKYDLEMLREIGFCSGVENYSRVLSGRPAGSTPFTLLDYFPEDYILFVDESHVTLPQVRGMSGGDTARKKNLVDYGFRLPSAYDNRPLYFEEFEQSIHQAVFVSATPGDYENEHSTRVVEQLIRPTGLLDPAIEVRPIEGQVDDLMGEIRIRAAKNERVLVTTLTKKMAEDLTEYLEENGIRVRYIHFNVDTLERMEILRDLRLGAFDVLVGINLLREGLDIPEVSLVAILDADKEGFLRAERSLIQTIGRAARNAEGRVIMYADEITRSMRGAIRETERRRSLQDAYNKAHGITPRTVVKSVRDVIEIGAKEDQSGGGGKRKRSDARTERRLTATEREKLIAELTQEMKDAARRLEFEQAAFLRDEIRKLREGKVDRARKH
ncbi:MAG: excinuclease ABC subunit UvrB [Clostridia bacterium]|nr:excinuclease ABC subunit UvrB [Clostridia bacterium]MBQ2249699.1 excinuclease ABC subunit UvrB [Clostridia bacterium]MBQ5612166.1 excinuclease ABC subunit UvrB [Clostridia bacterium]MBQ5661531.1 excinuclease ABC subunit UvrB [Clostridia bacterium]MBQ5772062.1 excinuclease ABC subunit UvrB [Clostridia bacterium]